AGLIRHESQVPGFNVPEGHTIGERVKKNAAEHAEGYGFQYGAVFRRRIPRRKAPRAATIAPASLKSLLEGKEPFALIDVREAGEYNSSHIPGASLIAPPQPAFHLAP